MIMPKGGMCLNVSVYVRRNKIVVLVFIISFRFKLVKLISGDTDLYKTLKYLYF